MTICPRCLGEKQLPTLSLVGQHWRPIAHDICPDCKGTGIQSAPACQYCGMPLGESEYTPYCSDVCQHKAARRITLDNKRFQIRAVVGAPKGGWRYGENVTIERAGYVIELRIGLGGCVMTRTRKKGTSIEGGLIVVERR